MSRVGFLIRVILVATKKGSTLCREKRRREIKSNEEGGKGYDIHKNRGSRVGGQFSFHLKSFQEVEFLQMFKMFKPSNVILQNSLAVTLV